MATEFPGNSQKAQNPPVAGAPAGKKIEKVVVGEVIHRKKPLWRRFKETFTGDDTKSVGAYVLFEVIVPAAKDMVADVITQGVERKLWGEVRSASRRGIRPGTSIFGNASYNAYNRYAQSSSSLRPDPRQTIGVPARRGRVAQSSYDEIVLATRAEASAILDQMIAIIDQYQVVTVSDLWEMVGVTGEHTDEKWGWSDLINADVQRINEGYLLNLPSPHPIED